MSFHLSELRKTDVLFTSVTPRMDAWFLVSRTRCLRLYRSCSLNDKPRWPEHWSISRCTVATFTRIQSRISRMGDYIYRRWMDYPLISTCFILLFSSLLSVNMKLSISMLAAIMWAGLVAAKPVPSTTDITPTGLTRGGNPFPWPEAALVSTRSTSHTTNAWKIKR